MCTAKPLMTPVNSCTPGGSGCYDTTWGGTGMVLTNTDGNVPPANDGEWGVVVGIQPDGKIVSIGQSSDPSVYSIQRPTVVRYNFDGSLDTTFAVNGVAMTSYGTGFMATSGLLQPDGKIVVVGWTMGSTGKVTVARFNSDGTQDPTFAGGGSTMLPEMYTGYTSAALQSDGKIVLASGENTWTLARLNGDGALDGSFGTGGIVTVNFGKRVSRTQLMSVAIQLVTVNGTTQERIVIGGDVDGVAAVKRFLPTGALDTSFGSGGTATAAFCGAVSRINRLAIDSNNRIVAVGQMSQVSNGTGYAALARFTTNGLLDTSFGDPSSTLNSTGMTGFNILGGTTNPWGLVLDTSGRLLVSSSAYNGSRYYMATARLSAAGALDATFGNGGVVVTDFGGTTSNLSPSGGGQLAVQSADGKIVVTGYASFSLGTYAGTNFATIRLWP